jgi:exopolyphosphatase / guanosine-5'-triphosphate,3'-diphosphate pyrophosphatase
MPMTPTSSSPVQPRLAAIDVGTNTIRLTVAEIESDGTYRILDEEREMVRLGEHLDRTGRLSDEAIERALAAIGKMKAIADGFEVRETRAIATSAVREAANGRAFCREVLRRHKVRIDVISGEEEAQLAFGSASRHFSLEGRSTAVVDIGGGSLEVILATGTVIDQVHSLPLGAVRVTERLVRSDPLKEKHWKLMRKEVDRSIRSIGKPLHRAEIMVGSGGTFTALAHMAKWQREGRHGSVQGYVLTPAEVVHLLDQLREAPLEARRQIPGLSPDRADIIVAGATVISRLVKRLGTQQILVNESGIREGLLLRMISDLLGGSPSGQIPQPTDRMEWVRLFARKCRSNERHCEHVAMLALQIFDGIKARYRLPASGRDILQAAALLHDIGYLISHSKHHKHAYHLVMHGDLPTFDPHEVEIIANVARYHRRAFPKKSHPNLTGMSREDRQLIGQLSGILRIADGLDRTHASSVTAVKTRMAGNRLRLEIEAASDPDVERADAERKSDLFKKAFDTELDLTWRHPLKRGRLTNVPRNPRLHVVAAG